jgi:triosephosphate isomerase
MAMIQKTGCTFVLCGHSERRQGHGESDQFVAAQVDAALRVGLHPVVCVGETKNERETKRHKHVVERQVRILPLTSQSFTIAYEPVWAIGTGLTATAEQAQDMHAFIRSLLPESRRASIRILYGGSMKPENAEETLRQPDIDGGLIGAASLNPQAFAALVAIAAHTRE